MAHIRDRIYLGRDLIEATRRGLSHIEMELMPEDTNFFDFQPDADKITGMASGLIANLEALINRVQGTT